MLIALLLIILVSLLLVRYCNTHPAEPASDAVVLLVMITVVLILMAFSSWFTAAFYMTQAGVFSWVG